jgi:hypothetical protein
MVVAGRIAGWLLIALAVLLASGDAVLAFGTGDHQGIVAGTLWTLITGRLPEVAANASLGAMLMAWPAWVAIGPVGLMLVVACRPRRHRRFRYRRLEN